MHKGTTIQQNLSNRSFFCSPSKKPISSLVRIRRFLCMCFPTVFVFLYTFLGYGPPFLCLHQMWLFQRKERERDEKAEGGIECNFQALPIFRSSPLALSPRKKRTLLESTLFPQAQLSLFFAAAFQNGRQVRGGKSARSIERTFHARTNAYRGMMQKQPK